jgi:hypothetical protein
VTAWNPFGAPRFAGFRGAARPASLLRESIQNKGPADIGDSWLHCTIQITCQFAKRIKLFKLNVLCESLGAATGATASIWTALPNN